MPAKHKTTELGTGTKIFYAIVCLLGLVSWIVFAQNPGHPLFALPGLFALPAAGRLHANYFRRIR